MTRTRPFLTAAAALAAACATALLPALTSATPASATVSCAGTSLRTGAFTGDQIRVPTVGNATPNQWRCNLGPGNAGPAVARLQIDLNNCYGKNLAVDGIYGPNTENAVKSVQSNEGVPVDGVYGPMTITGNGGGVPFFYQVSGGSTGFCDYITNTG